MPRQNIKYSTGLGSFQDQAQNQTNIVVWDEQNEPHRLSTSEPRRSNMKESYKVTQLLPIRPGKCFFERSVIETDAVKIKCYSPLVNGKGQSRFTVKSLNQDSPTKKEIISDAVQLTCITGYEGKGLLLYLSKEGDLMRRSPFEDDTSVAWNRKWKDGPIKIDRLIIEDNEKRDYLYLLDTNGCMFRYYVHPYSGFPNIQTISFHGLNTGLKSLLCNQELLLGLDNNLYYQSNCLLRSVSDFRYTKTEDGKPVIYYYDLNGCFKILFMGKFNDHTGVDVKDLNGTSFLPRPME